MNWAAIGWLVLLIIFLLTEAATVAITSVWFAAGALAAMTVSLLGGQMWLQVLVFLVVSAALLCALRPIVRKFITPKLTRTNVDAVIGSEGLVIEPVNNILSQGRVKLGAMEWAARSSSGAVLEAGTQIKVDRIEGVKVFVTPVDVTAQIKS